MNKGSIVFLDNVNHCSYCWINVNDSSYSGKQTKHYLISKEGTKMKKINRIGLVVIVLALMAAPAMAASDEIVNLGRVEMSRGDLDRLRAMVAGESVPVAQAPAVEARVNVGAVELAQNDLDRIRALMAGTASAPVMVSAREEMVDAGRVVLPRSELEALKIMVSHHLEEFRSHLARLDLR
jgi:hypothetical protein